MFEFNGSCDQDVRTELAGLDVALDSFHDLIVALGCNTLQKNMRKGLNQFRVVAFAAMILQQ